MGETDIFQQAMSNYQKLYVVKRGGEKELVDYTKITTRIERLCNGLNMEYIDVADIVMKVVRGLCPGVSTCELDNLTAEICAAMSTIHPDYGTLAAKIFVSNLHKETDAKFSTVVETLYRHVHPKTNKWMPLLSDEFYENVAANKDVLDAAINYTRDFDYTYFGLKTLAKAYLIKIDDKCVERPQHLIMRVAVALHGKDLDRVLESYEAMSKRFFTHATPTLFNAGCRRGGLSSCFLLAATEKDDSIENIYKLFGECAVISKYAGGIGISIHDIRAKGSLIASTNGKSRGIVPLLKVFNESTQYVTQSDKRNGSIAVFLEPWHAEIFEFLELKENHGDQHQKATSLFYGLWIPDLFMEKAKSDEEWCLFCPNEARGLADVYGKDFEDLYYHYEKQGLYRKKVKAQKLLERIIECQIHTGIPYICFKDAVNRKNNQKHIGTIRSSNLCVEVTQFSSHEETSVCNLASICLPNFVNHNENSEPEFDFATLHDVTRIVTRNLDRVIDVTHYPSEKARRSNLRHRPMGIGVSGLADAFSLMRLPFDSVGAKELNKKIFETIAYAAYSMSCDLAQELGAYPSYQGSEFSHGKFQWDLWEEERGDGWKIQHSGMWDWEALRTKMKRYGMRNSLLTATMPTASTSQIMGVTEAFEPLGSNVYKRETMVGEFVVINRHLLNDLCERNLWNDDMKKEIIRNEGSIQNITNIPAEIRKLHKITWDLSQKVIIDLAADRAPYIDQSQSMNVFIADPTFGKMTSLHFYAYHKGLKTGMYYLKQKPAAKPLQVTAAKYPVKDAEDVVKDVKSNKKTVGTVDRVLAKIDDKIRSTQAADRRQPQPQPQQPESEQGDDDSLEVNSGEDPYDNIPAMTCTRDRDDNCLSCSA